MDRNSLILVLIIIISLGIASGFANYLKRHKETIDMRTLEPFFSRLRGWWSLFTLLTVSILLGSFCGNVITIVLFALMSFWAMREFLTLTPTRPADHITMFLVLFICTIVQYVLIGFNSYEAYSIFIPIYAFLLVPACITLSDDSTHFLERAAKIDMGMLICIYSLSYAPAILTINVQGSSPNANIGIFIFFIVIAQVSDVLHYLASSLFPIRHHIAPSINSTKTWEGVIGSSLAAALIGTLLCWVTPFPYWCDGIMGFAISMMGAAGSMTLSAIKRDRGVKDYGTLIEGHSGILDRIDSICFAAPMVYHLATYFYPLCIHM